MIEQSFLRATEHVDFNASNIQVKCTELFSPDMSDTKKAETAFLFVRDEIHHSFDCQTEYITSKASDVLKYEIGICHAKSNLLVALLRSQNIPAGFCFEHITIAKDDSLGYCVHGFVAAYVEKHWIKLDPRGNKDGISAQFSLTAPILAYPPRKMYDEYFFPGLFANPHKDTMEMLKKAKNLDDILTNIPEFVLEKPDIPEEEAFGEFMGYIN